MLDTLAPSHLHLRAKNDQFQERRDHTLQPTALIHEDLVMREMRFAGAWLRRSMPGEGGQPAIT
jgi:hypothetical protein